MNKKLLLLTLPAVLIVGGCFGNKTTEQTEDTSLSGTTVMDTTTPTLEQCQAAVTAYLDSQKDVTPDTSKTVKSGDMIVVDYIGRLADGTVFDTSVESVAKECGLYSEARDYTTGLDFEVGTGGIIAGFNEGVIGMALNETKTVEIPAAKAYGGDTVSYPKSAFPTKPDGTEYKAGEQFMTYQGAIEIVSVSDDEIAIKNDHPLANKDLIFDFTVKSIN